MGIRSQARQSCLQILYQIEIAKTALPSAIEDYFSQRDIPPSHKEFTEFLLRGVCSHLSDLDQIISKYAKNWQISRMAIVDKNILRMGVFELFYTDDIPPRVTINEAVELAKTFGDLDSPKFVNGILDSVFRKENVKKNAQTL